jgi:hypothetical protein
LDIFPTFTVVIAQKVRFGLDPSISALSVIIITATLFLALLNEAYSTHAERHPGNPVRSVFRGGVSGFFAGNPAAFLALLMLAGIVATRSYATRYDPTRCKVEVLRRKLEIQGALCPADVAAARDAAAAAPGGQAPTAAPGWFRRRVQSTESQIAPALHPLQHRRPRRRRRDRTVSAASSIRRTSRSPAPATDSTGQA